MSRESKYFLLLHPHIQHDMLMFVYNALVVELVDTLDSKSSSFGSVGSIPTQGTKRVMNCEF